MPRIALIGFRPFERDALASYLRLMAGRSPAYEPCDQLDDADWAVVDADQAGFVQQVRQARRTGATVFVGRHAPPDAAAWLQRPIDPQHLLRELDVLVAMGGAPVELPTVPAALADEAPLLTPPRPFRGLEPDHPAPPVLVPSDMRPPPVPALPSLPELPLGRPAPVRPAPQALLLDPQEASLKFLEQQLGAAGLHTHRCRNARDALAALARSEFSLLVLEADLGEDSGYDGLTLCQHIKRDHVHLGEVAPRVLLLSGRQDAVQRVRAQLAGADEFLSRPLLEADLRRVLHRLVPAAGAAVAA